MRMFTMLLGFIVAASSAQAQAQSGSTQTQTQNERVGDVFIERSTDPWTDQVTAAVVAWDDVEEVVLGWACAGGTVSVVVMLNDPVDKFSAIGEKGLFVRYRFEGKDATDVVQWGDRGLSSVSYLPDSLVADFLLGSLETPSVRLGIYRTGGTHLTDAEFSLKGFREAFRRACKENGY